MAKRNKGVQSIGQMLFDYDLDNKGKYISREFQDYGYRLAMDLGEDKKSVSLYIKLAKIENRALLEKAKSFVKDASKVRHKGRLFMWALKKLKDGEPLYEKNK